MLDVGIGIAAAALPEMDPALFGLTSGGSGLLYLPATTGSMTATGATFGSGLPMFTMSVTTNAVAYSWSTAVTVGGAAGALAGSQPKTPQAQPTPTAPQAPKKNCPPVPAHPKNADVDANIRSTEAANAADQTPGKAAAKAWWVNQVRTNGVWDYKTQSQAYDDFGNFNYGATGTVFNYSLSTLEQGAAAARFMKSPLTQLKKYGLGNDPHKNDMIRQGMQYKQDDCGHF